MAANDPDSRSTPPKDGGEYAMPRYPASPPSIISSRMTDIASEDGDEFGNEPFQPSSANPQRRSGIASESRPGTAKTGFSSSRGGQPHRIGLHRVSLNNSISGSTGRPPSAASKSHVPSLTSHAFFHPMSSQKLQAQRGAVRTSGFHQRNGSMGETTADSRVHIPQQRTSVPGAPLSPISPLVRQNSADGPLPPSRGTEITEPEAFDRVTATTSPTQGHYAAGSLTDSVRPLQQRGTAEMKGLSLDVNKSNAFGNAGNLPTPSRTPRSFRSSFLLPSRGEPSGNASHRNMPGAEKLSSGASSPQLSAIDTTERAKQPPPAKAQKRKLGRNYEYFEGNTVFALGGRLQNTRHRPISIATALAVVIPAVLFLVYSGPFYWYRVSPVVPIVFAYLFYLSISSFIHASSSDPGILPRNLHRFPPAADNEDPLRLAPPMNDWTLIKSAESSTAAMEVPTKYCKTCSLWRPPRAHHCRLCDNCVETQDHHCVWLNNCVGRRNYRYFFTFVTATTLLGFYLVGASLAHVVLYASQEGISVGASIDQFRVPFAMFIYGLIATIYPAALMGYHLFLMARGETTREFLNSHKFLKKDRYRAFTQGSAWKNWVTVLCRPRPPTYYRFKSRFEEGDQRFGERRDRRQPKMPGHSQDVELQNVPPLSSSGFQGPTALRNTAQSSQP